MNVSAQIKAVKENLKYYQDTRDKQEKKGKTMAVITLTKLITDAQINLERLKILKQNANR